MRGVEGMGEKERQKQKNFFFNNARDIDGKLCNCI